MNGMKYTKYGIAFGLIIVTVGIAMTIKYGYRPAPARIMKPSFFENGEQIGVVALKRFYAQLADEHVVVLGLPTNRDWAKDVARGFVAAAKENQRTFAKQSRVGRKTATGPIVAEKIGRTVSEYLE